MQIINTDGEWLRNNAQFPMQDPEIGFTFQPLQVVKIKRSAWAKSQVVIAIVADPLASPQAPKPIVPAVKKVSPV